MQELQGAMGRKKITTYTTVAIEKRSSDWRRLMMSYVICDNAESF